MGIDAGQQDLFLKLDMPFFRNLVEDSISVPVRENLIDRGWAKMFMGESAANNGAFYFYPALDGTLRITDYCNLNSILESTARQPLWKSLNQLNVRTGFMNTPTTSPAPEVNGFMVSGGGGGLGKASSVPVEFCFPPEIKAQLDRNGYVLDIRMSYFESNSVVDYYRALIGMLQKRTESFIRLCKTQSVDFGFIAFRVAANLFYLSMFDILQLIDGHHLDDREIETVLLRLVREIDNSLKRLFEGLTPNHYIVVSDHGMAPYRETINLNEWLSTNNYQVKSTAQRAIHRILDWIRFNTPMEIKQWVKRRGVANVYHQNVGFSKESSQAFALPIIPGVFLNDNRFFGVIQEGDRQRIMVEICDKFNSDPLNQEKRLHLQPNVMKDPNGTYNQQLPDLYLNKPDHIHHLGIGPYHQDNPHFGPVYSLQGVKHDNWTGIKGRSPIFLCDEQLTKSIDLEQQHDLTLVYATVISYFSETRKHY